MPAKGNEKPVVENRVKTLQRRWSTPVPKVQDLEELNAYLRECCLKDQQRISSGKTETIGSRLEQDKKQALSLPKYRFDPCIRQEAKVCKYQFAQHGWFILIAVIPNKRLRVLQNRQRI